MMERVLVLGTVGRERIHSLGRVSPIVYGGTGFYATEATLKAGVSNPLLLSILGHDLSATEVVGQLTGPINASGLQQCLELPSFYWEAQYSDSFQESVTLALENRLLDAFEPNWHSVRRQFPNVHVCYLAAFDPRVQLDCRAHFEDAFVVSETLDYWINRDLQGVLEVARRSDALVLTSREFRAIWHREILPYTPHREVAGVISDLGLAFIIVTFAERGCQVFDSEGAFFVPALRCRTIDSTGAGNAFCGGVVAHLSRYETYERHQLPDAVSLGTVMGALQVQDFSNHALRRATTVEILSLQARVRAELEWFDGNDQGWRASGESE